MEKVYGEANPRLCANGVDFHWWDSMATSMHCHTYYEIFIITSGRTWHILNDERSELSRNALYFLRPEDCHQFLPIGDQRCVHINLAVTQEKLCTLCGAVGLDLGSLTTEGPACAQLRDGELAFFLDAAERLNYLARVGGAPELHPAIICGMVTQALLLLSQKRSGGECPEWFEELLRRLGSPENVGCTADDVYRMCGFSAPVTIHYFRWYTGQTVAEYLKGVRMDCACDLLRTTNLTTLEIAGRLGYDSLSHFNRIFKEHTGRTPREYRTTKK